MDTRRNDVVIITWNIIWFYTDHDALIEAAMLTLSEIFILGKIQL